ncbi:MAG: efflux RND transporter permease subunit [Alphaproteobacteria bacterium]|nr:efflux RND transporter permease subunit [Alphaproteobacteria bacterium]MBU1513749.1 efflux RND transporter permease subunit [Alphaproteobacteria bacterium]MBU2094606.1 efflux RND transporter permease subunit [Alphaproteobacteria bacterium]MBU2150325.1 efflux RND transporter permease subunit [Alphaproteobacteria bacterium]MBU2309146.1 efflux RND transporter permease subunit [Alphaproteobacteria bacterium]
MISRVFIDRPVFAWVIAIVIMLAGVAGMATLSVEQYPDIAPPSVNIRASYPGASAEVLEASVTQVIEQQLTGIDGLIYFSSNSNAAGQVNVTVTFVKGTDPDIAQVQVQNKVQQALPRLPQQVQQQGLVVTKSNADFLMVVSIYDASDKATSADVSDYLVSNLQEPIGRIPGVGDVSVFGSQYAMRIWLDPFKLASFKLMPSDVIPAIEAQNTQVAAGQIGGQPSPDSQMLNATVTSRSRLTSVDQFRKILVKAQSDGSRVLLQDVARVELGSENYTTISRLDGHPGAGIAVQLAPGADALKTAKLVRQEIESQAGAFPAGYRYAYPNDSTAFIKVSVREVVLTLFEAIALVVVVMFVFLQRWRATLIPAIAVPVVLLGTFGVLAAAGFSINVLTLFGLVLSIGLLVDDAIVVVENVERVMAEEPGISARDATIKSMEQVQTALIAIALVLSAVFLPMAFFGGSVGVIYRQFSITIVSSMVLSVVVALVLTPALAATLLKPPGEETSRLDRALARFGDRFNTWFDRNADRYRRGVARVIEKTSLSMIAYAGIVAVLAGAFFILPTSFLPSEDQGLAQLQFTLPPGATMARTVAAAKAIEHYFLTREKDNVGAIYTVIGQGQAGAGQNAGRGFISLHPWDDRHGQANTAQAITRRAGKALSKLRDVQFFALNPPPVRGLGQSSGFTAELTNTGGLSRAAFKARVNQFLDTARTDPLLAGVRQNSLEDNPTLHVDMDEEKIGALGLSQAQVDATLSAAWGGDYVDDFVDRGRVKRVYVQGDTQYRSRPEDLSSWFVRSASGEMAPFSSFARLSWAQAPASLLRFNGVPAYEIQGDAAEGKSTGQAMARVTEIASKLPGISVAWSGLSYQERLSGGQAPLLYAISLLVVFLCLAALYESWSVPFSVLLVIPLGLVGAAVAVAARGLSNDVYFQVGLLTTMGLSAKNAILIVEFAEAAERRGRTAVEAALEGARLRLRPILMTSFAFIFGVLPLAVATGAGARSRVEIGTAVIGGMVTATVLAIFFVPMFFVLVRRYFPMRHRAVRA